MAYINKLFIERLVHDTDIVNIISKFEDVSKAGSVFKCCSPLTGEKTPSFMISPVKQSFTDYSADKSGNVITYLMEYRNMGFIDAVEFLAKELARDIEYENLSAEEIKQKDERKERKTELRKVAKAANARYIAALKNELENTNNPASLELQKRGYSPEVLSEWQIGFAPGGKYIYDAAVESGMKVPAKALSLINDKNDKLWNRITYPIYDKAFNILGFASRDISGKEDTAKWLNPASSLLYDKSRVWFGMHRAASEIVRQKEAWIVEGYNDVISLHVHGLETAIASCGTSIHVNQIQELKKITQKVVFCMDADAAGIKSMLRHIPMFLKEGFSVDVCQIPDGLDPDDYTRQKADDFKTVGIHAALKEHIITGFEFILQHEVKGSAVEISRGVNKVAKVIVAIEDEVLRDIYTQWLSKHAKINKGTLSKIILDQEKKSKESTEVQVAPSSHPSDQTYMWPKGLKDQAEALKPIVDRYRLIVGNNKIYQLNADGYTFRSISNFEIEIIQHMNDDKFPKKLVRVRNVFNDEKIFDTDSQNFNSLLAFKNAITMHGNYVFDGNNQDLHDLTKLLFDQMGVGRKIDILGWQPDAKVWVWNNGITIPGVGTKELDQNGVFHQDETTYYVPSANVVYKNNPRMFSSQKRFVLQGGDISFENFASTLQQVHRGHATSALLFSIASVFQDIFVDKFKFFPLLFLYGPASSGKSQLAMACQSLFGKTQAQINLEQGMSTGKGTLREFAQFHNGIVVLNEYSNGEKGIDGMLKGVWDRQGYKRGTIDSFVSNEEVPITQSLIFTGNYYPMSDIVISRMIAEEMIKDSFSQDEVRNFDKLEDIISHGVSRITQELLHQRPAFEEKITKEFRQAYDYMSKIDSLKGMKSRYFQNAAVLASTFEVISNEFRFPFTKMEMFDHLENVMLMQKKRVQEASSVTRFWDLFLVAIRGSEHTKIKARADYKLEGNLLYFNYTSIYNRIQTEWYIRFQQACPAKMQLRKDLKDCQAYVDSVKSVPMDTGRDAKNTSADIFDIKKLDNYEEMLYAIQLQMNHQHEIGFGMGTNNIDNIDNPAQSDLPF